MKTIHHGKTREANQSRRFTIVGIYKPVDNPYKVSFGVALCGPKDHFSRKIGRTIAEGRARRHPTLVKNIDTILPETKDGKKELLKIGYEVVETISESPIVYQEILTTQYRKHKKTYKHR